MDRLAPQLATTQVNHETQSAAGPAGSPAGRAPLASAALVIHSMAAGGGERVVAHIATGLVQRSVRTMVICLAEAGPLAGQVESAGAQLAVIGSNKGYDFGAIGRLAKTLRRFGPEVINCHDRSSLPYVVLANCFAGRRPVVYTAHGLLYNADREPRLRHRMAMKGVRLATAVSEPVAARHGEYLAWRRRFEIIPNGVPDAARSDAQRSAVRRELGIGDAAVVFLAVGNARPEKAFEDLLDAAAALASRHAGAAGFRVLVAGKMSDSPYCRDLLARRSRLGLEGVVEFLGFRSDTAALYSAADVFVLSSRSEGLPMVLLEAMTAGLPVAATRVGGVPSAVPAEAGLLVDPASPDDLADAMATLADDADLRARLGAEARRTALQRHGVDAMVDRYVAAYEAAIGHK